MVNLKKTFTLFFILFSMETLTPIDNNHFYRARFLPREPRFEEAHLQSLDVLIGGGTSNCSYTCNSKKTPLLAIFTSDVPSSTFSYIETVFDTYHNLSKNFFFHWYLPIRHLSLNTRTHTLYRATGVGDLIITTGVTSNYEDTEYIDFIDTSAEIGLLIPTSPEQRCFFPHSLPLGYDGHAAIPLAGNISLGIYNWLTFGLHAETLLFFPTIEYRCIPLWVNKRPLWDLGAFIKADHLIFGLSLLIGYGYTHKKHDHIHPYKANKAIQNRIHHDPSLQGWQMHTINLTLEYDFATYSNPYRPRLAFVYNAVVAGRNIFTTPFIGGYCGFDLTWDFA
ncbi:MAG TPA: hypothetical protein VHA52_09155 [Candidatus Babeliaceae bacterium]|nr:hypothetical protein [Candidatus Babeliaceae bacterium]